MRPSRAFVGPGPELLGADSVQGDDVYNYEGERLGTIRQVMIDVRRGRVGYVVLSHGGLLGLGDRLFPIPWAALTIDPERACFLLDLTARELESAPDFGKSDWPDMSDLNWATTIHAFYGLEPYWE
jgi:hypothetical protein